MQEAHSGARAPFPPPATGRPREPVGGAATDLVPSDSAAVWRRLIASEPASQDRGGQDDGDNDALVEEVARKRDAYRMLRHMRTQEPIVWAMLDAEIYWQAKWCLSTSSGNCAHAGRVQ